MAAVGFVHESAYAASPWTDASSECATGNLAKNNDWLGMTYMDVLMSRTHGA